jgi:hypothetical protein
MEGSRNFQHSGNGKFQNIILSHSEPFSVALHLK